MYIEGAVTMTSRVYRVQSVLERSKLAIEAVNERRRELWEEAIDEWIEQQTVYRLEASKFGIFNWFPKPFVAPTREEADEYLRRYPGVGGYYVAEYESIFENMFANMYRMFHELKCQAESIGVDDNMTISAADWALLERWSSK